ncbi:hypothetical protein Tco_0554311 [Tanacetum coccineum]
MSRTKKQLARCQQGWVDNLSQVLWVHITLLRNNDEETPFSLTYGSEAIIPIVESIVVKDSKGRRKEVTKRKESKEVALIEKAYYQNELRRYHSKRNSPSNYKVCSFMLCDLDFEPLSLSLSSMPSCDLVSLTNMLILLHYLESFKSELAEVFVFKS